MGSDEKGDSNDAMIKKEIVMRKEEIVVMKKEIVMMC
jgi:hypothetical protein